MHFLRLGLISLIVLFLLVTGISLFIPSRVRVSRTASIHASRDTIMACISDPSQWKKWFPDLDTAKLLLEQGVVKGVIISEDPKMHIVITGKTADHVTAEYINPKMKPIINGWNLISEAGADSITLQWYMDFHLRWYPWEKFGSIVLERSYGTKMERGLIKLRKLVEN